MPRPKQKISIFSLAKEFGVSAPTISKALSNNNEVSDAMRQKVRERADELGFKPTRPRRKSFNICLVLDTEFHSRFRFAGYQEAVVEGVYRFCDEKEVEFSLFAQTTEKLEAIHLTRELHLRNADGAVFVGTSVERNYFEQLAANRFPFCCVFDGPEDRVVTADNFAAGRLAFDHLYELGHRSMAIARQSAKRVAARDRFSSFVRRAGEVGLPDPGVHELVPQSPFQAFDWGRTLLSDWLQAGKPWTAIFCLAENVALGFLSEAAVRGVRIPDEVSVLTCDDLISVQRAAPPLSVVDIPNENAGYQAALSVWKQLAKKDQSRGLEPEMHLQVTQVIARQSTCKAR